MLGVIYLQIPL